MSKHEVIVISKDMRTTSMQVGRIFNKQHAHVLRAIESLDSSTEEAREFNRSNFGVIDYIDGRGRAQRGIEMSRDGFSLLAMGFTGSDAHAWKLKFLAAFNAMEAKLLKENDKLEWKAARLQIKQVRRSLTDAVKDFVEYATAQGSQSAKMYYQNITKMEYAALDLLERQKTSLGNFRDTLDLMDISSLVMAETVAKGALEQGMRDGMHYKEIYMLAKQRVNEYANSVSFLRIQKC